MRFNVLHETIVGTMESDEKRGDAFNSGVGRAINLQSFVAFSSTFNFSFDESMDEGWKKTERMSSIVSIEG